MGILGWIIIGLLAGWIAQAITPGEEPGGLLTSMVLGIAGAIVGGFIMNLLGGAPVTGLNPYSLGVAVLGSWILLWGYSKVKGGPGGKREE